MENSFNSQNILAELQNISVKLVKGFADYVQVQKEEAYKAWTISDAQSLSFYVGICQNFFEYLALIFRKVYAKECVFL